MKETKTFLIGEPNDYTIDDIGAIIQPPQYIGTDNKLIEDKIPSVEDWKKDVASQSKGVRFLGEISPDKMKVTSINQDKEEKDLSPDKNINQELQSLVDYGTAFNEDTNWLVFNDNGTEKLVSKKPLRHSVAWVELYNANVVFGKEGIEDLINVDFTNNSPVLKDFGKGKGEPKTYEPTYVTVNNKKYIVRLMRGYSDDTPINDRTETFGEYDRTKGSEWNRLILSLIDLTNNSDSKDEDNGISGRYGSFTKCGVEDDMPTLAHYSWWTDFGGNNDLYVVYGVIRWTQEVGYDGKQYRALRGHHMSSQAAAYANSNRPSFAATSLGWIPVLERID